MIENKKVVILTANFYPEDTAIGLYTTQFAEHLSEKGYSITVITGFPYYPQWKINPEYKKKNAFFEETVNDIRIIRYKQFVPSIVSFSGRVKMMLTLLYGTIRNIKKVTEPDLVICIVPFTLSIIPAFLLSRRKKSKLWIHIQDFEFELAFQSGILQKRNFLTNSFKSLIIKAEQILLAKADVVSSISYSMLNKIKEKTINKDVYFFPNWVSVQTINPENAKPHPYIDNTKFTLLYSGNIGEKQDWKKFEDLCKLITDSDIEIVIVGDGGYLTTLKEKVSAYPFIKFYPPVPFKELSDMLCAADLHFLFQKEDVIDSIMPSKILGMMASGKPSLITGSKKSEVLEIMTKSNGGFYYSDQNVSTIHNTILNLKSNPDLGENLGVNARKFVTIEFSNHTILNNFESKIQSILP